MAASPTEDIEILTWSSGRSGPHLLVFGAIHGNEVCGAKALRRLAREFNEGSLRLTQGRLTCVPVCNPEAFRRGVRCVEDNLNRVFSRHPTPHTYEQRLANRLTPLFDDADFFLDLHSMHAEGEAFVLQDSTDEKSLALGRSLGAKILLIGWPDVYREHPDKLSDCTQSYAARLGVANSLIECGSHASPAAEATAYLAVKNALLHLGLLAGERPVTELQGFRFEKVYFRESADEEFVRAWKNLDVVQRGTLLTQGSRRELRAPFDGFIVFPHHDAPIGTEWLYLATSASA